jgi:hypothetical protein
MLYVHNVFVTAILVHSVRLKFKLVTFKYDTMVTWDFVMDKSGAGAGFLLELRFLLPIYIPSASPQSSSLSPKASTIGQEWPQCQ